MCSTVDDEDRLVALVNEAISDGILNSTPAWKKATKDSKAKEKRRTKAAKEALEAEELAKELGVHDKLFGNKGKGKGKGKKDAESEDPEAGLRALIQGNQAKRMDSMLASIEAKYGAKENKKGKKRVGEDAQSGSKKQKHVEVSPNFVQGFNRKLKRVHVHKAYGRGIRQDSSRSRRETNQQGDSCRTSKSAQVSKV